MTAASQTLLLLPSEGALWRIELFGGLRARRLGGTGVGQVVDSFRTQKAGALLAFFAVNRRLHGREWLAGMMWPDTPIDSARNSLRVSLSSLRTLLENKDDGEAGLIIRSTRDSAGAGEGLCCDLDDFRFWTKRARTLEGEDKTDALQTAFNFVTGPFLRGIYEDWAVSAARRFENEYVEVARTVIAAHEKDGELLRALDCARQAAMVVPDSHGMMRDIIRLGVLAGESTSVKNEFDNWKKRLHSNGITASPDWNEFVSKLNVRAPSLDADGPSLDGTASAPNGVASTSDVIAAAPNGIAAPVAEPPPIADLDGAATVENAQSVAKSLRSAGPALRPRDLPVPLSNFVGRALDREEVGSWLHDPSIRLITLLGPGGAGKTRLSLELARLAQNQGDFEAVVWVAAAAIGSMRVVHNALCDALGVFPDAGDVQTLSRTLGGSAVTGRLLLVFDNFEHLGKEGAQWIESLLEVVPRATALVTSRNALLTPGEHLWILAPLQSAATPEDRSAPLIDEEKELPDAVQLFIERAGQVRPDFSPTRAELSDIAYICQALGGLPLAIEVAAARLALFSPSQLALEIHNARQPRLVKAGNSTLRRNGLLFERSERTPPASSTASILDWPNRDATAPARHRSLREAIDWSVRQLPAQARSFWARSSVFRDAFSLEAAGEVCEEANPASLLLSLRDSSLLSLQTTGHVPRAFWNDALREFAQALLSSEERARLDARHAAYFLRYAHEMGDLAGVGIDGPSALGGEGEEQQSVSRRVRDELDASRADFRAAFEWFLTRDPESALELGTYIWATWAANKRWAEGRSLLARALDAAPVLPEETPAAEQREVWLEGWMRRARALEGTGSLASLSYDVRSARSLFDAARSAFERAGDAAGVARCLNAAGLAAIQGGDLNAASDLAEQTLSSEDEAQRNESRYALFNLSLVAIINGDFEGAHRMVSEALVLHRAQNDLHGVALCLESLGQITLLTAESATSHVYYEAALKNFQALGIEAGVVRCWWGLGHINRREGNLEESRACLMRALDSLRISEHFWAFPYILEALALLAGEHNNWVRAVRLHEGAKHMRRVGDIGLPATFFGWSLNLLESRCREELGPVRFEAESIIGSSLSREDLILLARDNSA